MFRRLSNGWALAQQSFRVLLLDKELLLFPAMSGLACLLVLASFALPLWQSGQVQVLLEQKHFDVRDSVGLLGYALLFAFYFVNYFVIVFFNAALIECAVIRFRGGDPTVGDGLRAAWARLPQIAGWALVSATVGVVLRAIESRSQKVGQIVAGLLGMAWGAATYFVVPVLVVERVGPVDALKRSFAILKKTWGEALTANFSIGLFVFLANLAAVVPALLGLAVAGVPGLIGGAVVTVALWMLIGLASAALNTIVLAAVYLYAAEGDVSRHFDAELLRDAFVKK
ncbi:MAG TPA: DUF6159 family protein [Pirellulales bacterium]|jgi:hypothetical protein|nr:DUF6159 family protein [Pirellulales bacterium]